MTFRKPYNPDLLGPFDQAIRKQEEEIRKNNVFEMMHAEQADEDLQALANLSKKGAEWVADIQKKKEIAEAAEIYTKYKIDKHGWGINPIDTKAYKNRIAQEGELDAHNDVENDYQWFNLTEKGATYEDTSDVRWGAGVRNYTASKLIIADKMKGLGPHLKSIFGSNGEIRDPNRQYTIRGTGRTFRLGDPDVSSADLDYAYTHEIREYLTDPILANAPLSMVAPYLDKVGNDQDAWAADMQVVLDDKRSGEDRNIAWNDWDTGGRTRLSTLLKEWKNTTVNGIPIGYGGAMDLFRTTFLDKVGNGIETRESWLKIGRTPIEPGHKDHGINPETGEYNTYADIYPKFNPETEQGYIFYNAIKAKETEFAGQQDKNTIAYLKDLDRKLVEEYGPKVDGNNQLSTQDRDELNEKIRYLKVQHGGLWKGKRVEALLESVNEGRNPQQIATATKTLEDKEANFALTEADIDYAYKNLPIAKAKEWETNINKFLVWNDGKEFKKSQDRMPNTFIFDVAKIKAYDADKLTTMNGEIVDYLQDFHRMRYNEARSFQNKDGTKFTRKQADEWAVQAVNTHILTEEQKGEAGLFWQQRTYRNTKGEDVTYGPNQIGSFPNFHRQKRLSVQPHVQDYENTYGPQAGEQIMKDSGGDIETTRLYSEFSGIPMSSLFTQYTGEKSPMEAYNSNVSSTMLSYAIRNPQSWAAKARLHNVANYGAETISNNYDPDISPMGKAALILTNEAGYNPEDGETAKEFDSLTPEQLILGYALKDNGTINLEKQRIAKRVCYACGLIPLQDMALLPHIK
tara:strand:+ start:5494 stop:7890 length:2397 start_codon:yes stop_codon:yes gene_type:complete